MRRLEYSALEKVAVVRPVDRLDWLANAAAGKVVLDLGAYDETAVEHKRGTDLWLHARLARTAKRVIGVDNSERLPDAGLTTSANSKILRGDVYHLEQIEEAALADVIMACELIEHLPNAVDFLARIKQIPWFVGKSLIVTTPNAAAFHNAILGATQRESTHHDHLQIYSYKTLHTLFERAGYSRFELIPYHALFAEMRLTSQGMLKQAVTLFQHVVSFAERQLPMLAGGWIVRAEL